MKHTQGPWKTEKTRLIYQESTNQGIARLVSKGTQADACLIAAAPEMLEALEKIEAMLQSNKDAESDFLLSLIQPSIKKAKGE